MLRTRLREFDPSTRLPDSTTRRCWMGASTSDRSTPRTVRRRRSHLPGRTPTTSTTSSARMARPEASAAVSSASCRSLAPIVLSYIMKQMTQRTSGGSSSPGGSSSSGGGGLGDILKQILGGGKSAEPQRLGVDPRALPQPTGRLSLPPPQTSGQRSAGQPNVDDILQGTSSAGLVQQQQPHSAGPTGPPGSGWRRQHHRHPGFDPRRRQPLRQPIDARRDEGLAGLRPSSAVCNRSNTQAARQDQSMTIRRFNIPNFGDGHRPARLGTVSYDGHEPFSHPPQRRPGEGRLRSQVPTFPLGQGHRGSK